MDESQKRSWRNEQVTNPYEAGNWTQQKKICIEKLTESSQASRNLRNSSKKASSPWKFGSPKINKKQH